MPEQNRTTSFDELSRRVAEAARSQLRSNPLIVDCDSAERSGYFCPEGLLGPDVVYIRSSDTARTISDSPDRAGKKDQMRENTKAYEIKFTDGNTEVIMANSVEETATRIKFFGHVAGLGEFSSSPAEVIKSFKEDEIFSYRIVTVPEQNDNAVGKFVYRVNHTDGTSIDVKADAVMHAPGANNQPGRYAVVTTLKGTHSSRTEYLVPESRVVSIERFGATAEVSTVVVNNKTADKV